LEQGVEIGAWRVNITLTALATIGVLAATFYGLKLVQAAFHGPEVLRSPIPDLGVREGLMVGLMIAVLSFLGFYPRPVLHTFQPAMTELFSLRR